MAFTTTNKKVLELVAVKLGFEGYDDLMSNVYANGSGELKIEYPDADTVDVNEETEESDSDDKVEVKEVKEEEKKESKEETKKDDSQAENKSEAVNKLSNSNAGSSEKSQKEGWQRFADTASRLEQYNSIED